MVIDRADVGVYLDLLASRSDAAFDRFRDEHPGDLAAWTVLTAADDGLLDPADAGRLAAEAAMRMRALSNANANATVHLFLRCPFPIAVLLGRLTNTLRVIAYEWDNSNPGATDNRPQYVPALRVRASAPGGVIDEVLLPGTT